MPSFTTVDFNLVDAVDSTKVLFFALNALPSNSLKTLSVQAYGASLSTQTVATLEVPNYFTALNSFNADIGGAIWFYDFANTTVAAKFDSECLLTLGYVGADNAGGANGGRSVTLHPSLISISHQVTQRFPDADGIFAVDTGVLSWEGDVLTYDDDLVTV